MVQIVYATVSNLASPIGGVIVQAAHVAHLRRAGFDAKLASTYQGGLPAWVDQEAVFEHSGRLLIGPDDVLVLHDSVPRHAFNRFMQMPVRRVFFCQNHYFLGGTLQHHECLSDFQFDAFLCVSEPIARHLRDVHGVADPVIIRPAVKPNATPSADKELQICYMPRKRLAAITAGEVLPTRRLPTADGSTMRPPTNWCRCLPIQFQHCVRIRMRLSEWWRRAIGRSSGTRPTQ